MSEKISLDSSVFSIEYSHIATKSIHIIGALLQKAYSKRFEGYL